MGKNKPLKPKGAAQKEGSLKPNHVIAAGLVALLAVGVGAFAYLRQPAAAKVGYVQVDSAEAAAAAAAGDWAHGVGTRLGEPSPSESNVADACDAIRPLFMGDAAAGIAALNCTEFMRDHWEHTPLVSRAGREWNHALMRLPDVGKMIGAWPIRFFKNHGTAAMHKPASGFLADYRWERGAEVPTNAVDIAMEEQRTFVMHNLEVYWPPIGRLIHSIVRYFHAYTQTNLYISPPYLTEATGPHQDAHSVFIVQTHGAKRWCVHAPRAPLTLKPLQRGKNGDVIDPLSRRAVTDAVDVMGPPLLNITMRPGRVLYIPRGFFHHTSTDPAMLAADDVINGRVVPQYDEPQYDEEHHEIDFGQPSMALTLSILSEDVWSTWLLLLGEALQELPPPPPGEADGTQLLEAIRRLAARTVGTEGDAGARLREALPRVIVGACERSERAVFTDPGQEGWRRYAVGLLADAAKEDGKSRFPTWLKRLEPRSPLFSALDAVLQRKRIPCHLKREQIEAMLAALGDRGAGPASGPGALTGAPLADIDVDTIFRIEKTDRSYMPQDKIWFEPRKWM